MYEVIHVVPREYRPGAGEGATITVTCHDGTTFSRVDHHLPRLIKVLRREWCRHDGMVNKGPDAAHSTILAFLEDRQYAAQTFWFRFDELRAMTKLDNFLGKKMVELAHGVLADPTDSLCKSQSLLQHNSDELEAVRGVLYCQLARLRTLEVEAAIDDVREYTHMDATPSSLQQLLSWGDFDGVLKKQSAIFRRLRAREGEE